MQEVMDVFLRAVCSVLVSCCCSWTAWSDVAKVASNDSFKVTDLDRPFLNSYGDFMAIWWILFLLPMSVKCRLLIRILC